MPCSCSLWVYCEISRLSLLILYCGVCPKYYWAVIFLGLFTVPPRSLSRIDLKDLFGFWVGISPCTLQFNLNWHYCFTQSIPWNTSIFHCQFFCFNTFLSTVFSNSLFIHSPRRLSMWGNTYYGTDSWGTSLGQLSIETTWPFVAAFYYLEINSLLICESTANSLFWSMTHRFF